MPNTAVDMNSWAVSACYPQSTFYPLSDGPSIRNRRITKPNFRFCSTCRSRSQAPFYLYALHLIANQVEGTFGLLRYLWRRPPQSNCPTGTVHCPDSRVRVRYQTGPGWYFNDGSGRASAPPSKPPTYPTQDMSNTNTSLQ